MTPEERERTMEFLLQSAAQHDSRMEQMRVSHEASMERMRVSHEAQMEQMKATDARLASLFERLSEIVVLQSRRLDRHDDTLTQHEDFLIRLDRMIERLKDKN